MRPATSCSHSELMLGSDCQYRLLAAARRQCYTQVNVQGSEYVFECWHWLAQMVYTPGSDTLILYGIFSRPHFVEYLDVVIVTVKGMISLQTLLNQKAHFAEAKSFYK